VGRLFVDALVAIVPGEALERGWGIIGHWQTEQQRVLIDVAIGAADLEMQMRALRATGVAAVGDEVTFLHRKLPGRQLQAQRPGLAFILLLVNIGSQCREELVEVTIHGRISVGMIDIDRLAKTAGLDGHPRHVSVRCGEDRQVLPMLRADIETHVVVIGAKLAEIGGEADGDGEWIAKIAAGNFSDREYLGKTLKRTTADGREKEISH